MVEHMHLQSCFDCFLLTLRKEKKKLKGVVGESDVVQGCFVDFFHDDS